jgi:uncharacterized protein (TIGR00299 family) protein
MSRTLFVDPVGGIAGDMFTAALIDVGAELSTIQEALTALEIPGLKVHTENVQRGPFSATRFVVECDAEHHPHRTWRTIRSMLKESRLSEGARRRSLAVFEAIASAEAQVHGIPIEEVHFHEVGAWDSIADIVAASVALDQLQVESIHASAPPLSVGTIETAHGTMPLPAPATLCLLEGWPVRTGPTGRECTTPTGAGFLSALATPGSMPAMKLIRTGTGAGTRDTSDRPNVVRVSLGETTAETSASSVIVLEAQMDDLSGEHLPPLIDALLAAGALDATATPVVMKKGRSGLLITALAEPNTAEAVTEALLRHGSTFGVRHTQAERTVLDRWFETVETPWGTVRIKIGALKGEILHASPEYEDVAQIAAASGQPAPHVHSAALTAWRNQQS